MKKERKKTNSSIPFSLSQKTVLKFLSRPPSHLSNMIICLIPQTRKKKKNDQQANCLPLRQDIIWPRKEWRRTSYLLNLIDWWRMDEWVVWYDKQVMNKMQVIYNKEQKLSEEKVNEEELWEFTEQETKTETPGCRCVKEIKRGQWKPRGEKRGQGGFKQKE